jgi:hypothetical protein
MAGEDSGFIGGHTVIGVIQEALKEEKAKEEETETEVVRRRELRKSLNRRVSFASHATIRYYPAQGRILMTGYFHRLLLLRKRLVRKKVLGFSLMEHQAQTMIRRVDIPRN